MTSDRYDQNISNADRKIVPSNDKQSDVSSPCRGRPSVVATYDAHSVSDVRKQSEKKGVTMSGRSVNCTFARKGI